MLEIDETELKPIIHVLSMAAHQGCCKRSSWLGFARITISQGKNKILFYKKQLINKSTRVILDLFSLLYYNTVDRKNM